MKEKVRKMLIWSEKYTKTDMVYLASGTFWVGINKVFIFTFSFLLMLAFANLVSKETFGSYQYILSILGITSVLSLPGANISLMKSISQGKEGTLKKLTNTRIKWSFIGSFIILSMALWYLYKANTVLGLSLAFTGIFFPFFQSYDSFEYFWNGRKNFKKGMYYNNISSVLPILILILTIIFFRNLIIIIIVFTISNVLIKYLLYKKTLSQIQNNEIDEKAIELGKSLTIIQGMDTVSNYIDKIFIWKFLGPISVAIYSFAQIPISKIQQLAPIQTLSLPKLSEQNIEQEKKSIIKKFLKLFLIIIPITLLFIFFIPILYKVFFPQYLETIPYVRALGSLLALMPFTYITTAMIAESRGKELIGIQTTVFITKIILFFIFTPIYGIWGIIYATIITEILKSSLTYFIFLKNKNSPKQKIFALEN